MYPQIELAAGKPPQSVVLELAPYFVGPPGTTRWEGIVDHPTKLSQFTNDGVFLTRESLPPDLATTDDVATAKQEAESAAADALSNAVVTLHSEIGTAKTDAEQTAADALAAAVANLTTDIAEAKSGAEHTAATALSNAVDSLETAIASVGTVADAAATKVAVQAISDTVTSHNNDKNNPHDVTPAQIGTLTEHEIADRDTVVSTAAAEALNTAVTTLTQAITDAETAANGFTFSRQEIIDKDTVVATGAADALAQAVATLNQSIADAENTAKAFTFSRADITAKDSVVAQNAADALAQAVQALNAAITQAKADAEAFTFSQQQITDKDSAILQQAKDYTYERTMIDEKSTLAATPMKLLGVAEITAPNAAFATDGLAPAGTRAWQIECIGGGSSGMYSSGNAQAVGGWPGCVSRTDVFPLAILPSQLNIAIGAGGSSISSGTGYFCNAGGTTTVYTTSGVLVCQALGGQSSSQNGVVVYSPSASMLRRPQYHQSAPGDGSITSSTAVGPASIPSSMGPGAGGYGYAAYAGPAPAAANGIGGFDWNGSDVTSVVTLGGVQGSNGASDTTGRGYGAGGGGGCSGYSNYPGGNGGAPGGGGGAGPSGKASGAGARGAVRIRFYG